MQKEELVQLLRVNKYKQHYMMHLPKQLLKGNYIL